MSRRCTALLLATLPGIAWSAVSEPAGLQARMRAPADEIPAFALHAEGVQVFECRVAPGTRAGFAWTFTNPDATLYEGARSVGIHRTPNTWESSSDRSVASGTVRATQPAGGAALPWTLFRAQGSADAGLFSGVTSVQRVNTTGGVAPAGGCSDTTVGTETRVPFTADYYFYRRAGT